MNSPIVEARDVVKHFPMKAGLFNGQTIGTVRAVDGVSFEVRENQTFALVGESGCGKSTMANLLLKLLEPTSGELLFRGTSLVGMSNEDTKNYRRNVQPVLQDPYGALNPRMRIGHIIGEPLEVHGYRKADREERVAEALRSVGLRESVQTQFPHEFSGGQGQRIGVARALTLRPDLIILDEPVSSLDVSIRSQVLNLLKDIQDERRISYILISYDLASVEHMSHTIGVMYLGNWWRWATPNRPAPSRYTLTPPRWWRLPPRRADARPGRYPLSARCPARWKPPAAARSTPGAPMQCRYAARKFRS